MKQATILFVINLILFGLSLLGFTPYAKDNDLEVGNIILITPVIASASFIYIKVKKVKSPFATFVQSSNVFFFIFPLFIGGYLILCFLNDWEVKFL